VAGDDQAEGKGVGFAGIEKASMLHDDLLSVRHSVVLAGAMVHHIILMWQRFYFAAEIFQVGGKC
jgi:hypothetical protein